jgi:hypothetical protein
MPTRKPTPGALFLCLTLSLMGCADQPPPPQVKLKTVEVSKDKVVMVPETLLAPCRITPLPERGDKNIDLAQVATSKDAEQHTCNHRFDAIRQFLLDAAKKVETDAASSDPR